MPPSCLSRPFGLSYLPVCFILSRLPLFIGQHKNRGKSAVEEALRLRKSRDAALDYVKDLRKRIMDTSSAPWETATAELELETALQVLRKAEGKVKRKEDSLGVTAKQQLRHLMKSPFLTKKMNARALKTRIRERLRSRKFELDRLERSYRKQRSGKTVETRMLCQCSLVYRAAHQRTHPRLGKTTGSWYRRAYAEV